MEDQNTELESTAADETGVTSTELKSEGSVEKLFTQDQVNKLIAKEKAKVKKQFEGYEELQQTVQTLKTQIDSFKEATKALEQKYLDTTYQNSLEKAAREVNLDIDLAIKHIDKEKVIFVEDKPTNLKELLQAEIEKFPQLVKKAVSTPTVANAKSEQVQKFTLHKQTDTSGFFKGGGLRLNRVQES